MLQKTKELQLNKQVFSKLNFIEESIKKSLQEIAMIKYLYADKIIAKNDWKPKLKSLKGLWSGVKVDEEDFKAAEKSLFPYESS